MVAVHARLNDVPYLAGGLCAKLIQEGYTGYIVRTCNDEKYGGRTIAENILSNEQEHLKMAQVLGFKDVFDLYYRSHFMDAIAAVEIQSRLVLLFRMLKVDTVITLNPSAQGDDDTDHMVTAHAVQEAAWMAGQNMPLEIFKAHGTQPQTPELARRMQQVQMQFGRECRDGSRHAIARIEQRPVKSFAIERYEHHGDTQDRDAEVSQRPDVGSDSRRSES